ncbi:JmjC domain-containing protein [Streptomyces sp. NPDC001880]
MTTDVPTVVAHLGEDFLAQVYGRTYRHFPGEPGRFGGLLGWDDLNALLTHHRIEPPRLRLSVDGEALPQHAYSVPVTTRRSTVWHRLKPAELHRRLAEGATLVLDAIDELHPGIGRLAQELERHLRTGTQVNAYASWTPEEGFGVHWDDHDVLVLQLDGAKPATTPPCCTPTASGYRRPQNASARNCPPFSTVAPGASQNWWSSPNCSRAPNAGTTRNSFPRCGSGPVRSGTGWRPTE